MQDRSTLAAAAEPDPIANTLITALETVREAREQLQSLLVVPVGPPIGGNKPDASPVTTITGLAFDLRSETRNVLELAGQLARKLGSPV